MFKKNVFMRIFGDDGIHGGTAEPPYVELKELFRKYQDLSRKENDLWRRHEVLLQDYKGIFQKLKNTEKKLKIALDFMHKQEAMEAIEDRALNELRTNDMRPFYAVNIALREIEETGLTGITNQRVVKDGLTQEDFSKWHQLGVKNGWIPEPQKPKSFCTEVSFDKSDASEERIIGLPPTEAVFVLRLVLTKSSLQKHGLTENDVRSNQTWQAKLEQVIGGKNG